MNNRLLVLGIVFTLIFSQSCKQKGITTINFLDANAVNSAIKPGDNFFRYANGKWLDTVKIQATEMGIGSFQDLQISTRKRLQEILDSVSKATNKAGSIEQKVGDLYASAIDSVTVEKRGFEPIKPYLQQINGIKTAGDVMQYVANQQMVNNGILFNQGFGADDKNSALNVAAYWQGGLGLPDRDYYFKTDSATLAIVKAYQNYVTKLFILTGDDSTVAAKKMLLAYGFEKELAATHSTNIELRDPQKNYNKLLVANLDKQMPAFNWKNSLGLMGVHTDSILVQKPAFFMKINELLTKDPIPVWQAYLAAHTLTNYADRLSNNFVTAAFAYTKTLNGQQQIKLRVQRMVDVTDQFMGEALGQLYVKKYFSDDAKKRMLSLVNNLQLAFDSRISNLQWMSDSTKTKAKEKLHSFIKKIGFPDKWRDYSKVNIDKNKYFENLTSSAKNEYQYQLAKVGTSVDKMEWTMSPPTINAYYNPVFNEIVFPAGILQFPFFDASADDAINYGGIGVVIGHEMTHGFDDHGAQYNKDGNLKNWWSRDDSLKFATKTSAVAGLYNGFTVLDTMHVKGALTNGENIADMGGVAIAYDAFKLTPQGKDTVKINGFTPDQRFFLSYAQIYKLKLKDAAVRMYINTDPHSPEIWRVNGVLMNFMPFYKAFDVKPGDKMYRGDSTRIMIW